MPRREIVQLYARPGAGKSFGAAQFGLELSRQGGRTFTVDTERGWDKMLSDVPIFSGWEPMVFPARTWPQIQAAVDTILGAKPKKGDLIVVEMVNRLWDAAQDFFTESVHGKSAVDVMLSAAEFAAERKTKARAGGLDGMTEWPIINKIYNSLWTELLDTDASVILTAGAKELMGGQFSSEQTRDLFSGVGTPMGLQPEGNKRDPHMVDTVMFLAYDRRENVRTFTTVKDRGRELQDAIPYTHLFADYYSILGLDPAWQ